MDSLDIVTRQASREGGSYTEVPLAETKASTTTSPGPSALHFTTGTSGRPSWRRLPAHLFKRRPSRKRALYVVGGLGIMAIWVGLILAFVKDQSKKDKENLKGDSDKYEGRPLRYGEQIWFLEAALKNLNTDTRTLSVGWSGKQLQDGDYIDLVGYNMTMYRDVRAVYDPDLTSLANDQYIYFSLDNATAYPVGSIGMREWDSFDTDIDLEQRADSAWRQPLRGKTRLSCYPLDEWQARIVLVAMGTDTTFNGTRAFAVPLGGAYLANSLLQVYDLQRPLSSLTISRNWKIAETSNATCRGPDPQFCELHVELYISRPGLVKFSVIAVVLVNWLSTIVIFMLTGEALLVGRLHIVKGSDMLSVMFAALFALPGVRSLLPGAPAFGYLIGILPNVIIISLCIAVWAGKRLHMEDTARKTVQSDDSSA
ncbi:hypothetical protein HDZ31DRAFT_67239 [Schizophyllum fasciatum]